MDKYVDLVLTETGRIYELPPFSYIAVGDYVVDNYGNVKKIIEKLTVLRDSEGHKFALIQMQTAFRLPITRFERIKKILKAQDVTYSEEDDGTDD